MAARRNDKNISKIPVPCRINNNARTRAVPLPGNGKNDDFGLTPKSSRTSCEPFAFNPSNKRVNYLFSSLGVVKACIPKRLFLFTATNRPLAKQLDKTSGDVKQVKTVDGSKHKRMWKSRYIRRIRENDVPVIRYNRRFDLLMEFRECKEGLRC